MWCYRKIIKSKEIMVCGSCETKTFKSFVLKEIDLININIIIIDGCRTVQLFSVRGDWLLVYIRTTVAVFSFRKDNKSERERLWNISSEVPATQSCVSGIHRSPWCTLITNGSVFNRECPCAFCEWWTWDGWHRRGNGSTLRLDAQRERQIVRDWRRGVEEARGSTEMALISLQIRNGTRASTAVATPASHNPLQLLPANSWSQGWALRALELAPLHTYTHCKAHGVIHTTESGKVLIY